MAADTENMAVNAESFASSIDDELKKKEAELRRDLLEMRFGKFKHMEYPDDEAKRLWDEDGYYVYHIIDEGDTKYYLGVDNDISHWYERDHKKGSTKTCYICAPEGGSYGTIRVEVCEGRLRRRKGEEK